MEQRRLPLHMVMETSSGQSACQLAALGVGVALADPVLAANVPGIVLRDFEPKLTLPYGFLLPNAYAPSEQAREFARIFVRLVKETAPQRVELGECSRMGTRYCPEASAEARTCPTIACLPPTTRGSRGMDLAAPPFTAFAGDFPGIFSLYPSIARQSAHARPGLKIRRKNSSESSLIC